MGSLSNLVFHVNSGVPRSQVRQYLVVVLVGVTLLQRQVTIVCALLEVRVQTLKVVYVIGLIGEEKAIGSDKTDRDKNPVGFSWQEVEWHTCGHC